MIRRIHHVGIVVKSIDEAFPFYTGVLGLEVTLDTVVEEQGVRAALLQLGDSELELLEPVRGGTGVARFLEKQGGLHHVCFETDEIENDLHRLKQDGVELIDQATRDGVAGKICFMHPRANNGVLIEYCQPAETSA
ncbi:MAG TPA: methylmalonyl-CoA epimerase [Dehalococcoidia bacterium]|nr:methylmalonyl-CoA epimerase [Dehalococcoidia bacterium]